LEGTARALEQRLRQELGRDSEPARANAEH
jgi:hypothetical protein